MSWLSVKLGRMLLDAMKEAKKQRDSDDGPTQPALAEVTRSSDVLDIPASQTQFTVIKCANGRLIKVSEYKPTKSHHPDWQHEIYIVKDDEKVPDVIARIMAIKALEQ